MPAKTRRRSQAADALQDAWNYPFFEVLMDRRSRRFGLGMSIEEGPNAFRSRHAPVPLTEEEEALLLLAGAGISGFNLSDMAHGGPRPEKAGELASWVGLCNKMLGHAAKTMSTPFSGNATQFFYTNDSGTYFLDLREAEAHRMREVEKGNAPSLVDWVRSHRQRLSDKRLELPRDAMVPNNRWNINRPGTTLFIPVVDLTGELINRIMMRAEYGSYLVDDRQGYRPCGNERWVKEGFVNKPMALTVAEQTSMLNSVTEPNFAVHNITLALAAMGLGGLFFAGMDGGVVLGSAPERCRGLGFRFEGTEDERARPRAVGLDRLFESYRPPYYKDMDAAVDAVVAKKFGPQGMFTAGTGKPNPYAAGDRYVATLPHTHEKTIQLTKDTCNYIWKTYGRFPASSPPMLAYVFAQAHHLDLEFYDKYYKAGAYTAAHGGHMKKWHGAAGAKRGKR